jgi:hypothetical protein
VKRKVRSGERAETEWSGNQERIQGWETGAECETGRKKRVSVEREAGAQCDAGRKRSQKNVKRKEGAESWSSSGIRSRV